MGKKSAEQIGNKDLPWIVWAKKEIGQKELLGSAQNPRILFYHSHVKGAPKSELVAWCSSFWCTALEENNIPSTDSAWARDALDWGEKLDHYIYGCTGVYERNGPGGDSHVGFVVGQDGPYDLVLAGNQNDGVNVTKVDRSKLLGYRWPKGYPRQG